MAIKRKIGCFPTMHFLSDKELETVTEGSALLKEIVAELPAKAVFHTDGTWERVKK